MANKENKWIKFYPSLELPKERVSIAYDTHDERGVRYAYGYFQFYNGTCGSFWKDGNEQPKVVKAEDIKCWMPIPSLDVQKELVNEDLEKAAKRYATEGDEISGLHIIDEEVDAFKAGANWQEQQMMKTAVDGTFSTGEYADGTPIDAIFNFDKVVGNKYEEGEKVKIIVIKK